MGVDASVTEVGSAVVGASVTGSTEVSSATHTGVDNSVSSRGSGSGGGTEAHQDLSLTVIVGGSGTVVVAQGTTLTTVDGVVTSVVPRVADFNAGGVVLGVVVDVDGFAVDNLDVANLI